MKNSALVVIDLQNDITKNYKEIIAKVNEAIDWAGLHSAQQSVCGNKNLQVRHPWCRVGTRAKGRI